MRARRIGTGLSAVLFVAIVLAGCRRRHPPSPTPSESAETRPPGPATPVEIAVRDDANAPLPSRIHLRNERMETIAPPDFPGYYDHFVFGGSASLSLPAGDYTYQVERGPEYQPASGKLSVRPPHAKLEVTLHRIAELSKDGWYSGDLHIHREPEDIELLMQAEDLQVGPVVTWGNQPSLTIAEPRVRIFDGGRVADLTAGEDERYGGALLFLRLEKPLALPPSVLEKGKIVQKPGKEGGEIPSALDFAKLARREPGAHVDIEKPFWWDVPTWLALGVVDSVEIAHNHMNRSGSRNHEAWGRRCDRKKYGDNPLANGFCTQDIYYRILDAGLRLPPSAGSASGVLPNPVGYDRVYVHVEAPFSYEKWWQGLKRGESFVTNGPLLLVEANGKRPGTVFRASAGETLTLNVRATLRSTTPIRSVELVRDGTIAGTGRYDAASGEVTFPALSFAKSGWFLVRALTDRTDTFRFAASAPFYVEAGSAPRRVSRSAARYFETWVHERIEQLEDSGLDSEKLAPLLAAQRQAERYWADLAARANAE